MSVIPAHLSDRWSKERRFQLCWEMLDLIRPSRLLFLYHNPESHLIDGDDLLVDNEVVVDLTDTHAVQRAYDRLNRGELISVILRAPSSKSHSGDSSK